MTSMKPFSPRFPIFSRVLPALVFCIGMALSVTPGSADAQDGPRDQGRRVLFGPRVELGYGFDASSFMGGIGAFVEADVTEVHQGSLAVTAAVTQLVFFESEQRDPSLVEGGLLWAKPDRRLILEAGAGGVREEGEDTRFAARFAVGREFGIDSGRALRVQGQLRFLSGGEATLGVVGSYPFRLF